MELKYGLRLSPATRSALVGAGGKTSAMFQIARDFDSAVVISTTTHLSLDQRGLADRHFVVQSPADIPSWQGSFQGKILLFSGPALKEEERLQGLASQPLQRLLEWANRYQLPLLIEADGARQLALKAPAAHEPPIPPFVDTVIVLAGLSALGQPLSESHVHRPRLFGDLAGMDMGESIQLMHMVRVLCSSRGGLKNIPPQARRILLLNQADTVEGWQEIDRRVPDLLRSYHAVGLTSLAAGRVHAIHEPIAGIVLAAGGSTRYGKTKQILSWREQPFVRRVAETGLAAGLDPLLVVTGADAERVCAAVEGLGVRCVHNPDWREGQSTSVQRGIEDLPPEIAGAVFLLADQPQMPVELVRGLKAAHAQSHAPIVSTQVEGKRANPVLFDRQTFPELIALEGDVGGRVLFERYAPLFVPWDEPGIRQDVDTPEDYRELLDEGRDEV